MDELGDDLVLLAVRQTGKLDASGPLAIAVAGSELVRLAAARRVDIVKGRIVVLDDAPTGDPLLDAALDDIRGARRPPRPKQWVGRQRPHLVESYARRLADAGVLRAERRTVLKVFPVTRWVVLDAARADAAAARVDQVARSTGPVEVRQAALAGLVCAVDLQAELYRGREGRPARKRLEQVAREDRTAGAVRAAMDGVEAARAATEAAIQESSQAAVHAAISASVHATHSAAAGHAAGGHAAGGGHGGH